jgi:hypothetical protein
MFPPHFLSWPCVPGRLLAGLPAKHKLPVLPDPFPYRSLARILVLYQGFHITGDGSSGSTNMPPPSKNVAQSTLIALFLHKSAWLNRNIFCHCLEWLVFMSSKMLK